MTAQESLLCAQAELGRHGLILDLDSVLIGCACGWRLSDDPWELDPEDALAMHVGLAVERVRRPGSSQVSSEKDRDRGPREVARDPDVIRSAVRAAAVGVLERFEEQGKLCAGPVADSIAERVVGRLTEGDARRLRDASASRERERERRQEFVVAIVIEAFAQVSQMSGESVPRRTIEDVAARTARRVVDSALSQQRPGS